MGRRGSFKPARARRTALLMETMASCCPIMRSCSLSFHFHQPFAFFVGDARDRDARPHRRHFRDIFANQSRLPRLFIPIMSDVG